MNMLLLPYILSLVVEAPSEKDCKYFIQYMTSLVRSHYLDRMQSVYFYLHMYVSAYGVVTPIIHVSVYGGRNSHYTCTYLSVGS